MCEVVIGLFLYQLETQSRSVQCESDCRGRHAEDDLAAYIYPVLSILCTCGTHLDRAAKVQKYTHKICTSYLVMYGISLAVEATFHKILLVSIKHLRMYGRASRCFDSQLCMIMIVALVLCIACTGV